MGLIPSDTGEPEGRKTGQSVTHYVEPGGRFDKVCSALIGKGACIPWQAMTGDEGLAKKKKASKTKYTCPSCGLNAWAKPEINLMCGECEITLKPEEAST